MNYAIIITVYYETVNTLKLCRRLCELGADNIVIVNDGAKLSEQYSAEIISMGCHVINLAKNEGKGASLKAGIRYAHKKIYNIKGFITVDSDGQHCAEDVIKVAHAMDLRPDTLVLGKRDMKKASTPFRIRLGNKISSAYFKVITGVSCKDTQTGLRGIPNSLYELAISTKGNRFDYDMNFLTKCADKKIPIYNISITADYSENKRSDYKIIRDSYLIYATPLRFATASIGCALIDLILFTLITYILPTSLALNVLIATVLARIVSGGINFLINRRVIFKDNGNLKRQVKRFIILFTGIMCTSSAIVALLSFIPMPVTITKAIVDILLWTVNYTLQRKWVFNSKKQTLPYRGDKYADKNR